MLRRWLLAGWIVWIMLIPAGVSAQGDPAAQVVAEVNAYRAALGLNTLAVHPALVVAAQTQADFIARTGQYGHTGEGGSSPGDRAVAAGYPTNGWYVYENYVFGTALTPFEAVLWWDQSPVHQATLRLPGYDHIGVGYAPTSSGNLYVLLIAKPVNTTATASSSGRRDSDASGSNGDNSDDAGDDDSAEAEPAPTVVAMVPVVKSEPGADGSIIHEVKQGQTVWTIAAVYGVNLMDIVTINHLGPHAIIKPGDRLIVKLAEGQAPPPAPTTHVVQTGETAWTIAALHGLTLDELLNLNGINRSTVLYPGDVVLIRQPDPTPLPTDIPPDTPDTPTPEPRPTRSDVTLAPTWTPSPTPTPSPVVPTLAPTATPAPAPLTKPANDQGGGEQSNRALLISLGVAIVGTILVAGGALIASRRQKL